MVEASTFQHLSIKYGVSSVPRVIINDEIEFIGSKPIGEFLSYIEKG